jgi:hypothetical protein
LIGGGHARLEDLGSPMPGPFWIFFLFFPVSSLLFGAALADATMGTTTSAVAHMASVKSRIANLLMRLSWRLLLVRKRGINVIVEIAPN